MAPLRERIEEMLGEGVANPWCGLCGKASDTWSYEASVTRFHTLGEAIPTLRESEVAQRRTADLFNKLFGDMPRSD